MPICFGLFYVCKTIRELNIKTIFLHHCCAPAINDNVYQWNDSPPHHYTFYRVVWARVDTILKYDLLVQIRINISNSLQLFLRQAEPGSDPLHCVTSIDVTIPPERVADMTGFLVDLLNPAVMELRRLFLLESIFDTLKFILCLWGLTYIGSW